MILINVIFIILYVLLPTTRTEIISLTDVEMLLQTQSEIVKSLQDFVSSENKRLNFLEDYLSKWKKEHEKAAKDVPHYLGNPINAFKLIKRLTHDLDFVENILKNKTVFMKNTSVVYPTREDVIGAVEGLHRLQTAYDLDIPQLANGIISGAYSGSKSTLTDNVSPMTANDCYAVGIALFKKKSFPKAIDWLKEALLKYEKATCNLCQFTNEDIIKYIGNGYHIMGDTKATIYWLKKRIALRPNEPQTEELEHFLELLQHKYNREQAQKTDTITKDDLKKFLKKIPKSITGGSFGCVGVNREIPQSIKNRLKCYFANGPHPFLRLARVKAETIFITPEVVMFHDIVSETEIKTILSLAKPKLRANEGNVTNASVGYRNAEQVAIEDDPSGVISRVTRRVSFVTSLSMENSEPLKVINYGIGGIYEQHYDCNSKIKAQIPFFEENGDRIATIMFYLSEVTQGGATVFPKLRLSVFPKKGAALFWYNLLPATGETNEDVVHEACPVLSGNKFIAIKWPHEAAQKECRVWRSQRGLVTGKMYSQMKQRIETFAKKRCQNDK